MQGFSLLLNGAENFLKILNCVVGTIVVNFYKCKYNNLNISFKEKKIGIL